MAHRPGPALRWLLRAPAVLYDWHAGWLLGHRFLRLTHRGRRSGRRYRTMLEVVGTGRAPGEVVVMVGLGPSADWYRNLQAGRGVEVAIGGRRFRPAHRVLDRPEAAAVLAGQLPLVAFRPDPSPDGAFMSPGEVVRGRMPRTTSSG